MKPAPEYGVQLGVFSKRIHAGRLNQLRRAFVSHSDVTEQAIQAVAQYIAESGGELAVQLGDTTYLISVEKIDG